MSGVTKDTIYFCLFLVVLPAIVLFILRRQKWKLRISFAFVVLVFGLVALPNFVRTRMVLSQNACVNNLHWIQVAKKHWAEVYHKSTNDVPTAADLFNSTNGLQVTQLPDCPAGGSYTIGAVGEEAKCSVGPPQHTLHPSNVIYVDP